MVAAIIVMLFTFGECLLHFEHCDQHNKQTASVYTVTLLDSICAVLFITHYCMCGHQNDDEMPLRGDDGVKVSSLCCSSSRFH